MSAAPPTQPPRRQSMRQRTFVDVIMIGIVDIIRMIIESDHIHLSSLLFFINLSLSSYFINLCLLSSSRGQFISSKFLLQVAFSKALPKCTQQWRFSPILINLNLCFSVLLHTKPRCVGWRFWPQNQIIC